MKSVAIYYFSGTGNTEIVANMIRDEFSKRNYSVDLIRLEDVLKNNLKIDIKKYDYIGIGSQVIAYSTPNVVNQFIKKLPKNIDKRVFIFKTAGGVASANYNASKKMIRMLSKKGYTVFHERIFSLSSNWIVKFDDGVIKQLHDATKKKVGIMCEELIQGKPRILKTGFMQRVCMGFIGFVGQKTMRLIGKDYKVNQSCNHCGKCIRNCPVDNIYEKNGKIKLKFSCNCCMRCVYSCPMQAIRFRLFSFFIIPNGYNIKKIIESPHDSTININGAIPPFFSNYVKDDLM